MRLTVIANINGMLTLCQSFEKHLILIYSLEQLVKVSSSIFHIEHMRKTQNIFQSWDSNPGMLTHSPCS